MSTQQYYGEWVDVTQNCSEECCDCGFTHRTKYAVLDGRILQMVTGENKKRTSIARRSLERRKEGVFAKNKSKKGKKK